MIDAERKREDEGVEDLEDEGMQRGERGDEERTRRERMRTWDLRSQSTSMRLAVVTATLK